ncbi:phenylalanine--tRNA ligase subunit beta [Sulfurivermis fontis]|uniref:phenylalanine--tRNA ligase subunit beta n=1 Tax=Sulfurivermis fontis TaxID=1972068 RepID=UPI000FDC8143|nr:phenylalanine--tRNA ligase subunit beta [Sulfurivermis fontis]
MKFSAQWLREWVNPAVDIDTLSAQLTMAGLEVDAVAPVAETFTGVVVGEVLRVEKHPDADKLRVCQVNTGSGEPLNIVCGAANVRVGLRVPTATIGAVLPGDFRIKRSKLRGVESFGMLCSAKELGLAETSDGLLELPTDAPVGQELRTYLQLDDVIFELGLTPNRGDCLSIAGIAREVGVINRCAVTAPRIAAVAASSADAFPVNVSAAADCPRYAGRVIRGINPQAATPVWMAERLRRSGVRSLGPAVDITNYLLLELGQPMHAFDLAKLQGGIEVRRARAGEKLTLLNGSTVELDGETLVIADGRGPQALAGVMGGEATAVGEGTVDIFLESAFFAPEAIAGRARRYGLHTDSSHRFERGVSPVLQRDALERATALFIEITGGVPGPVVEVVHEAHLPRREPIVLRQARIKRVLGFELEPAEVTDVLTRLGLDVVQVAEGWRVTAPAWRFDLTIEEDLIEELARIHGYDKLPSIRPVAALQMGAVPEGQVDLAQLRRLLVTRGYQEAVTYSFVAPEMQKLLDPGLEPLALANPISAEMAVMRTTLWAGLVQALAYNINRQQGRVRLFESGLRFLPGADGLRQERMIAGLAYGDVVPEQWGEPARVVDFFDLKGDVEALLALAGLNSAVRFVAATHPALHPGQSARIEYDGALLGWLGALHPVVADKLGLAAPVLVFELALEPLLRGYLPRFRELSRFPAVRRDIALVVDSSLQVDAVLSVVRRAAPDTLRELKLFDLYTGKGIDPGRKSLALGLTLQADSRTLTDSEVDAALEAILAALKTELGATLRD